MDNLKSSLIGHLSDEELKHELAARKDTRNKTFDHLWKGLKERPPSDDPGWKTVAMHTAIGHFQRTFWFDENDERQWQDYPNQAKARPGMDWYWIASGCQDLYPEASEEFPNGGPWNAMWSPAEFINQVHTEIGLERIRQYQGARPKTPVSGWPEDMQAAWKETHDSKYGLK